VDTDSDKVVASESTGDECSTIDFVETKQQKVTKKQKKVLTHTLGGSNDVVQLMLIE
jgi:hypothetical protein